MYNSTYKRKKKVKWTAQMFEIQNCKLWSIIIFKRFRRKLHESIYTHKLRAHQV